MASSLRSAAKPDPAILIGRILRPHGVRGELRVEPLTDFPERFQGLADVYVDLPGGGRWWDIEGVRQATDGAILLHFRGLRDPETAGTLRGGRLLLPRSEAVTLPADVYFVDDLKGLRAEDESGQSLGKVREVYPGAQDVLEIRTPAGQDVLVPLVPAWVPAVDVAGGRVVIANWPALLPEGAEATDETAPG